MEEDYRLDLQHQATFSLFSLVEKNKQTINNSYCSLSFKTASEAMTTILPLPLTAQHVTSLVAASRTILRLLSVKKLVPLPLLCSAAFMWPIIHMKKKENTSLNKFDP